MYLALTGKAVGFLCMNFFLVLRDLQIILLKISLKE
jgi:hypothetical protein